MNTTNMSTTDVSRNECNHKINCTCFDRRFLTVEEFAKYYRIHKQTVYKMVKSKRVPHFRVGASIRFNRQDVENIFGY